MAQIGDARTDRFFISMAEVRLGTLANAMLLTPDDSIGLLNSATVTFDTESVDLEAGLPRKLYDTQIVAQPGTIAMEMREYTTRNMEFLLGYAPRDYQSRVESTLAQAEVTGSNSVTVQTGEGANFAIGDMVKVYPAALTDQANISMAEVTGITGDVLTLGPHSSPLLFDYAIGDRIFNVEAIALGANTTTQYFASQVLGTDRRGNPVGFTFWKCALSSGLDVSFSADDFNTNTGELKILTPSAADIAVGGPLEPYASLVTKYPQGFTHFGGDVG